MTENSKFKEIKQVLDKYQKRGRPLSDILNDRGEKVIRLRFCQESGKKITLDKIGQELNITKERVRQIILQSFKKIKQELELTVMERLSVRTRNILKSEGIKNFEDCAKFTKEEFSKIRNCGPKNVSEIEHQLLKLGKSFKSNFPKRKPTINSKNA